MPLKISIKVLTTVDLGRGRYPRVTLVLLTIHITSHTPISILPVTFNLADVHFDHCAQVLKSYYTLYFAAKRIRIGS